ncbi:hypothetical protein A2635_05305 [Candidatus Peribacteria bacterium RIFCSPHIGHO2_01_FULL_51_9]|nr:MAG: hypothetical protein A2635_05305 [Candidatus Peribacteria bacterium RIFCSPHIGHO2_01_FULL_51_9]
MFTHAATKLGTSKPVRKFVRSYANEEMRKAALIARAFGKPTGRWSFDPRTWKLQPDASLTPAEKKEAEELRFEVLQTMAMSSEGIEPIGNGIARATGGTSREIGEIVGYKAADWFGRKR